MSGKLENVGTPAEQAAQPEVWRDYWDERAVSMGQTAPDVCIHGSVADLHPGIERLRDEALFSMLDLQPEDRFLDVGCGLGDLLSEVAPSVASAAGVDISPKNLELAGRRLTEKRLAGIRLEEASAARLPFEGGSFDKAVCLSVFQYLTDEECRSAFSELARVVSPGGRIVIHAKNSRSLYGLVLRAKRLLSRNNPLSDRRGYQRPWNWYLSEAAVTGTVARTYSYGWHFQSKPAWAVSMIGSLEFSAHRLGLARNLGKELLFLISRGSGL